MTPSHDTRLAAVTADTNPGPRRRIPVTCHPDAEVVIGHVAAARLTDPATPVFADPRDTLRAGDIAELDISCRHCASRELVDAGRHDVLVVVGHRPSCAWWTGVLEHAIRADADGIAALMDTLATAVTGAA